MSRYLHDPDLLDHMRAVEARRMSEYDADQWVVYTMANPDDRCTLAYAKKRLPVPDAKYDEFSMGTTVYGAWGWNRWGVRGSGRILFLRYFDEDGLATIEAGLRGFDISPELPDRKAFCFEEGGTVELTNEERRALMITSKVMDRLAQQVADNRPLVILCEEVAQRCEYVVERAPPKADESEAGAFPQFFMPLTDHHNKLLIRLDELIETKRKGSSSERTAVAAELVDPNEGKRNGLIPQRLTELSRWGLVTISREPNATLPRLHYELSPKGVQVVGYLRQILLCVDVSST